MRMGRRNSPQAAPSASSFRWAFSRLSQRSGRPQRAHTCTLSGAIFSIFFAVVLCALLAPAQTPATQSGSSQSPATNFPRLVDINASTGIHFDHLSSPEQRYIVESMSGGVALIDYDLDGYPDIYFTNAPSVKMALDGKKSRSALYHNNHDGTFTDVTDKAGVGYPCWAMGAAVGDYNNDGLPDLLVT
jgi:hypothetical protein